MNRRLLLLPLLLLWFSGCAVNPVTGEQDLVLMSEEQEISTGRQLHEEVLKEYGQVEDPQLQEYVTRIGRELATHSHRSGLVYRFTVLDSPEVNAFALPGGYIYITRGLLAYLQSEAQMAAVLGHELGHVTARHSVRQHAAQTVTGILGAVAASYAGVQGAGDLANILGTAITRGYGREHELEADRLGAEYLARVGHDPGAMSEVIGVLKGQEQFERQRAREEGREPNVYHGVFATHPDNDQRLQEVVAAAARLAGNGGRDPGRELYLHRIDGLVFGEGERQGVARGSVFYHRELGFAVDFPSGWTLENKPDRLLAYAPGREALMQLTVQSLNRKIPPREFLEQRLKLTGLHHGQEIHHQGLEGYTAITTVQTPFGDRETRFVIFYYGDRAYVFAGAPKDAGEPYRWDETFLAAARGFHPLGKQEEKQAEPQRIALIQAGGKTSFATLAAESPLPDHAEEWLRLLNGRYPDGELKKGEWVKVVR